MTYIKEKIKYINVLGVNTAYFEHVSNAKDEGYCLFLHGGAPGASMELNWFKNLDAAIDNGLNVIAFDQPGFGYSSSPPNNDHSIDFRYQHAVDFIKSKGIKKCHLIGNSIGGLIASLIALRNEIDIQIESLLLVSPYPFFPIPQYIESKMKEHRLRLGSIEKSFKSIKELCENTFFNKDIASNFIINLRLSFLQGENWNNHLLRGQQGRQFYKNGFNSIEEKTLVVWGLNDKSLPHEIALTAIKENYFPNSDYVFFKKCGHWPQTECYERFNEILLIFIKNK